MSMHYLPKQTVTRNYEARLVVRGEDLQILLKIVNEFMEIVADGPTDEEQAFVDAINWIVTEPTPLTQQDPFAAHVA